MENKQNKKLSIIALLLGLIQILIYLYNYLFIDYFSSIGIAESMSAFGFSVFLLLAAIINFKNQNLGRTLLWGCVIGGVFDRAVVFLLFPENTSIDILILPFLSSFIIGAMLLYFKSNNSHKAINIVITLIVISLIIVLPKVL